MYNPPRRGNLGKREEDEGESSFCFTGNDPAGGLLAGQRKQPNRHAWYCPKYRKYAFGHSHPNRNKYGASRFRDSAAVQYCHCTANRHSHGDTVSSGSWGGCFDGDRHADDAADQRG